MSGPHNFTGVPPNHFCTFCGCMGTDVAVARVGCPNSSPAAFGAVATASAAASAPVQGQKGGDKKAEGGKKGGKKGGDKKKGDDKKKDDKKAAPAGADPEEEKKVKAAIKEGGKKGQDLAGLSDLGGVKFFCVAMENCHGRMDLLDHAMAGMNKEVDENAEDRKGGAGHVGKMLLSAGDGSVEVICNVPAELQETVNIDEWFNVVLNAMGGEAVGNQEPNMKRGSAKGDPSKERFPLKMRDAAINASFAWLKEKKLVMDDDSDSDDINLAEAAGIEW